MRSSDDSPRIDSPGPAESRVARILEAHLGPVPQEGETPEGLTPWERFVGSSLRQEVARASNLIQARRIWDRHRAELLESPICFVEFGEGYAAGLEACHRDVPIGTKTKRKIPTDWSRGFVKGVKDMERRTARLAEWEEHLPYNEVVRDLRERYPAEFPERGSFDPHALR